MARAGKPVPTHCSERRLACKSTGRRMRGNTCAAPSYRLPVSWAGLSNARLSLTAFSTSSGIADDFHSSGKSGTMDKSRAMQRHCSIVAKEMATHMPWSVSSYPKKASSSLVVSIIELLTKAFPFCQCPCGVKKFTIPLRMIFWESDQLFEALWLQCKGLIEQCWGLIWVNRI